MEQLKREKEEALADEIKVTKAGEIVIPLKKYASCVKFTFTVVREICAPYALNFTL